MSQVSYIIIFNKKTAVFTLKSTKDEITVDAKHKKYEWLKGQEAGRIVKISAKGRWNSSKDYYGLYDEINSSPSKKKSTVKSSVKTTKKKAKSVKDNSTELKELKTQLKELQTSNNKLKTENTKLKNEIQVLKVSREFWKARAVELKKSKSLTSKPKPSKPKKVEKKQWEARFTVTESATNIYSKKRSKKTKSVTIVTKPMEKKPSERFLKQQLKLQVANNYNYNVYDISGLTYAYHKTECPKISNIILERIGEY